MAKDAKGHGSEARGSHAQGVEAVGKPVPGIDHPAYNTAQKVRGWNGPVSPLNADYSTSGSLLRGRMAEMSKDAHKAAGDSHVQQASAMQTEHGNLVNSATAKLGGRDPGPLISGIVSDKFSEGDKNKLRDLATGASKHTSAAFAHYAASGMRLDTARARREGLKG